MEVKNIIPNDSFIIGAGTRSICYRSGDNVYKEMPASSVKQYKVAVYEYELLKQYLGEYVHETEFFLTKNKGKVTSIIAKQNFIDGKKICNFILDMDDEEENEIEIFFLSCLSMYSSTRLVPDIFGRPHGIGWYNPLTTLNVLVTANQGPRLLDVGLSRISRMKGVGALHNFLLSYGIKNYMSK